MNETTATKEVRVLWNRFGVEVYAGNDFMGGLTLDRVERGPLAIAEAVRCILAEVSQLANGRFAVAEVEEH